MAKGRRSTIRTIKRHGPLLLFITLLTLIAAFCTGCATPLGGGERSPASSGGDPTATAVQGAQTIGGSQGQAETPQTSNSGPATINFEFSRKATPDLSWLRRFLDSDSPVPEAGWSPEQLTAFITAVMGVPRTLTFTFTGNVTNSSGGAENVGSSGGTGGSQQGVPVNPTNE